MEKEILKLKKQGLSYNAIAKKIGCSKSTVSYHCGVGQKRKTQIRNIKNYANKILCVKKRRLELKAFSDRFKSMKGCIDCFIKDKRVLDYDHVNRKIKTATVSIIVHSSHSLKMVKEEIRKCVVRCANCHRIKTIEEKEYKTMNNTFKYKQ